MSGFDQNPFADPAVYNPFADPAVQQAAGNNTTRTQQGLEDYNPFGDNQDQKVAQVRGATNPPPVVQATPVTPPVTQPAAAQPPQINTADFQELQRRQEELERKAQELQRREEELRNAPFNSRRNNWPPLPEKFFVQPCFYQDINVEIPLEFQKIVRMLYYIWMFHSLMYTLNVFGCLGQFIQYGSGGMFGLALLYWVLFTPASYVCWFRPVYKAFRSDSSFNFMVFFVLFFAQLIASVIQAVGFPNLGTCGFIVAISTFSVGKGGDIALGVFTLLLSVGFALAGLADFMMLVRVLRIYRSTGASMAKAQQEFIAGVSRNPHVRSAATDFATGIVRNQMGQASQPAAPAGRF